MVPDTISTDSAKRLRVAVTVRGTVQGVGFRPFVYRVARSENLDGWVLNDRDAVRIEIQGNGHSIGRFLNHLRAQSPPPIEITHIETSEVPYQDSSTLPTGFAILSSDAAAPPGPTIPADLATCPECLAEILDPEQRRYRYPFTNCTHCGPRWSIIESLPYDRPRTSMRTFSMCADCQAEYDDPLDRRFHAQPIACPQCGPRLKLLSGEGAVMATGDQALREAVAALQAGRIVALKGLGGFQLLADATRSEAVSRLRQRKLRPDKPLAVMMPDLPTARRYCQIDDHQAALLRSPAAPILLVKRLADSPGNCALADSVAPGNPWLGVMLPYTPLHHLICRDFPFPFVCTSGNLSEEPMATSTAEAVQRLGAIADCLLTHDRPILRPVDDSVARLDDQRLQILRRARGFAPLPIRLHQPEPTILAVGGHLKNTVAMNVGDQVIFSSHIGDLDNLSSLAVHRRAIEDLIRFFAVRPARVACDLHPDYLSTRLAEQLATAWEVPLIRVQHHHAHVAACVAEHQLEGPVLGFAWDGTGYGTDRTVWGGEILMGTESGFCRVAHLRTFPLPGGDAAAREPRRSALGILSELLGDRAGAYADRWFTSSEGATLLAALRRPGLFPRTSSLGRLFDAVAVLCGLPDRVSYEAQAAIDLEFAVAPGVQESYPLTLTDGDPAIGDWEPMIRCVLDDLANGVQTGTIAAKFHNGLADWAVEVARRFGCPQIVLSGGCFQNRVLQSRVRQKLRAAGFRVFTHQSVPPGDGGIALGQIFIAAKQYKD